MKKMMNMMKMTKSSKIVVSLVGFDVKAILRLYFGVLQPSVSLILNLFLILSTLKGEKNHLVYYGCSR